MGGGGAIMVMVVMATITQHAACTNAKNMSFEKDIKDGAKF
jgi:hypothetical protein